MSKSFFRSFLKDSLVYMLPTILAQGVNFFLVPLYTRVLSPSDYGVIDMLKVFSSLALLVVALEISQGFGRFFVDEKTDSGKKMISSTSLLFTVFTFSIFLLLCQLFAPFLSKLILGEDDLVFIFRIGSIYIAITGVSLFLDTQLRYELKSKQYSIKNILLFLVTAFTSVVLSYVMNLKLLGMVIGLLIGSLVSLIYGAWLLRSSYHLKINKEKLVEMLLFSIPLVPTGFAVFFSSYMDRLMINYYLSLNDVGLYGIGFRVGSIVILLISGVNRSLAPLIYNHYEEIDTPNQISNIFRYFIALAILFYVTLSLFSIEILTLLTTAIYYESSKIIIYIVPAILLSQMYIFAPGLGIEKKTKKIMFINIGGALCTILLNWIFIPNFGYKGAAFATFLTYLIVFIVYMSVSQRYYFIPFQWKNIIFSAFLSVPLAVSSFYINFGIYYNIIVKILLIVLLPFIFIISGLIRKEEMLKGYKSIRNIIVKI